jgi:hypothetical protein
MKNKNNEVEIVKRKRRFDSENKLELLETTRTRSRASKVGQIFNSENIPLEENNQIDEKINNKKDCKKIDKNDIEAANKIDSIATVTDKDTVFSTPRKSRAKSTARDVNIINIKTDSVITAESTPQHTPRKRARKNQVIPVDLNEVVWIGELPPSTPKNKKE